MDHKKLNQELIEAAKSGNLQLVQALKLKGVDIAFNNNQALRLSSANGYLEVVKYLLEQGADIHAENDYLLKIAAKNGHLAVVKCLIEKGADLYANNDCALKWASEDGRLEIIKYFLFDCQMKISKKTKIWLIQKYQHEILNLIEKRDLLLKLNKDVEQNNSVDNNKKIVKL